MGWTWAELRLMWQHPDWTAGELHEVMPNHSVLAIRSQRHRMGRTNPATPPLCCLCGQRPVGGSLRSRQYGVCEECWADEYRKREEEEARASALKQMRSRNKRRRENEHGQE